MLGVSWVESPGAQRNQLWETFGGTQAGGGRGSCGLHEFVKVKLCLQ